MVVKEMMDSLGLEKERYALVWCSSAEAARFVEAITSMTETLQEMGPSPFNRRMDALAVGEGGA